MYMENLLEVFCQKIRGKAFDFNTKANPLDHEKKTWNWKNHQILIILTALNVTTANASEYFRKPL